MVLGIVKGNQEQDDNGIKVGKVNIYRRRTKRGGGVWGEEEGGGKGIAHHVPIG
jgi:hypothetical protein